MGFVILDLDANDMTPPCHLIQIKRCKHARKPQVNDALRATNAVWYHNGVERRTIQGALKDVTAPPRREVRVSLEVMTVVLTWPPCEGY